MKRFTFFIFLSIFCLSLSLGAQEQTHVIQKGETLYSLAKKYGFSVEEICEYNSIVDATKVKVGQRLKIPSSVTNQSTSTPAVPKSAQTVTSEYIVQSGDTFYSLARKHDLNVQELLTLNKLPANAVLKTGQKLLVPSTEKEIPLPVLPPVSSSSIALSDPRQYENRKLANNIIWPVKNAEIVYATGKTFSVVLTAQKGDRVTAIKSGVVIFSGMYRGFGQVVFVHSQSTGYIYVYSGLESVGVSKGQKVNFGDTLGTLGLDSISKKAQLNFMVYYNGKPVDPAYVPRG